MSAVSVFVLFLLLFLDWSNCRPMHVYQAGPEICPIGNYIGVWFGFFHLANLVLNSCMSVMPRVPAL